MVRASKRRPGGADRASLYRARIAAGFTVKACAARLRVTERTVRNWEAGRARAPYSAILALRLVSGERLPGGVAWRDFRICGAVLITSEGREIRAEDLAWLSLTFRRAEAFRQVYRRLQEVQRVEVDTRPSLRLVQAGRGYGGGPKPP